MTHNWSAYPIVGTLAVPIPRDGLACSLILELSPCSVAVEDGKLEFAHYIRVRLSLDIAPDLGQRFLKNLGDPRIELFSLAVLSNVNGISKTELYRSRHSPAGPDDQ